MKKSITSFVCQECGYDSPSWLGKCPECGEWNSLKEIRLSRTPESSRKSSLSLLSNASTTPKKLHEITYETKDRIATGFSEMDGVLGGGLVSGQVTLLAGDPGIGKSTLLLQLGLTLAKKGHTILYVSGEESVEQIKLRANRLLGNSSGNKILDSFLLLSLTNTDAVSQIIQETKPSLVIVDSIQTMESENVGGLAGAVGQIRYSTAVFIQLAKTLGIPTILVGHVTKEGMVAGPMMLSHMVDTVLFFEGEKTTNIRILRSLKNRFGPVDEVGIFTMEEQGISEALNPQKLFLETEGKPSPGSVLVATLEGTRAFLVEIQALVIYSKLPMPRRVASGIDAKRLELLLAVLQKHGKLPVDTMDVFVNVAGGLKLSDRAVDLGVCLAIYSSLKNVSLPKTIAISEVGLLGELRPVIGLEKRTKEAKKMGFSRIISAKTHKTLAEVIGSL